MNGAAWNDRPVRGGFVRDADRRWYRIENVDRLPPFLTTIASSGDHWLFASSRGPLTAGRRDARAAVFPYTTDDKLHDGVGRVGPRTIVHVEGERGPPWEPGIVWSAGVRDVSAEIWKDEIGAALRFVEHEHRLGLTLTQDWETSDAFGLVRTVRVANTGGVARRLRVIDGLLNLLPADVEPHMQSGFSNLVDAYKTARVIAGGRAAVFALNSVPVDRAEPSEALRATTVRCIGADGGIRYVSERQLEALRRGDRTATEATARGLRGACLVDQTIELRPGDIAGWTFVLEVEQDAAAVAALAADGRDDATLLAAVRSDVERSWRALRELIAAADAFQDSGSPARDARHASNTLFNLMRGGTFPDGHDQRREDFAVWLGSVAPQVFLRSVGGLPDWEPVASIGARAARFEAAGDPDLVRLQREYLPLAFSRRHGDPSRPWNTFAIPGRLPDGGLRLGYEGNWRDIFQNWEALALAFPGYAPAFVARFVNASTADGYNPYRITRAGVDWEVEDPDDPWSFIGYWGDHQIAYLTRLIDRTNALAPGALERWLDRREFVSVDVPYRIRGYASLVADPRRTVDFDHERARAIEDRRVLAGNEGRLVTAADRSPVRVTFVEKLLVPLLVKWSNLVPGAGVWMNTQRPEWNDANNALVGSGASVVTACAMWGHARVVADLVAALGTAELTASTATLLRDLRAVVGGVDPAVAAGDAVLRRRVVDAAGRAGEAHRERVYAARFGHFEAVPGDELRAALADIAAWCAATVALNRRDDGLYHAYNLIAFDVAADGTERIGIRRLPVMLEGQVAVLSAGMLDGAAAADLLDALRASPLHANPLRDAARGSYLLYPDREPVPFETRNRLPSDHRERFPAAAAAVDALLAAGDHSVVRRDDDGTLRFAPAQRNARLLAERLSVFAEGGRVTIGDAAQRELLAIYEEVFDHAAFTGRSGTFFGYEGLGCIYWHMVSKLALAVQEAYWRHVDGGGDARVADRLRTRYAEIRAGLGMDADPAAWGAFPTDAYSHTPRDGGARQPGMTGQVKEDLLCRLGEVGVRIVDGELRFAPDLLTSDAVRFTLCGVPIVVERGDRDTIAVQFAAPGADSEPRMHPGRHLDVETSARVFRRAGEVAGIHVTLSMPPHGTTRLLDAQTRRVPTT